MAGREDGHVRPVEQNLAGEHIHLADALDLIAKELDP